MESRFFLNGSVAYLSVTFIADVVEWVLITELDSCKDESLLIRGNTLFVLNLIFGLFDGGGWIYFKSDGLACQCLDEDLH